MLVRGPPHAVARERAEHLRVHGLEHLPVQEAGQALRAERSDLDELVLAHLVAQPPLAGRPRDRAQHERARLAAHDRPPVDGLARADLGGATQRPALSDELPEQRACSPRERQPVPLVARADAVEIGVDRIALFLPG